MNIELLIAQLNEALAFELRASIMYAHYAAYVSGIHRLHLSPYFEAEATESNMHAQTVRHAIVKLGGVAVMDRDPMSINHTTDYREILKSCLETEKKAAETYGNILGLINGDDELYDSLQQIYFAELRAVEELNQLM
jgi:bacterioferritin